jgi:hypothetical protein
MQDVQLNVTAYSMPRLTTKFFQVFLFPNLSQRKNVQRFCPKIQKKISVNYFAPKKIQEHLSLNHFYEPFFNSFILVLKNGQK